MQVRQLSVSAASLAQADFAELAGIDPQLVLVFACIEAMQDPGFAPTLAAAFPRAQRVGCSTAGEISNSGVDDGSVVVTAIHFNTPAFRIASVDLAAMDDSRSAGQRLAAQLAADDLSAVLIFGQGVAINGSALIDGVTQGVGPGVVLTGGLAGDAGAFERSWTLSNQGVSQRAIVAIGWYGSATRVAHGSFGGWQPFGPPRRVTRARGNLLQELDGEPALDVYKRYLGEYARDLPASGLLFPFAMLGDDLREVGLIRTILGIDESDGSLILAGEVQQGGHLRLMHADTNALVNGAQAAARAAQAMFAASTPGLALLISCVGRKLVMGGRTDDEVEAVAQVLGAGATLTGFYSNGEISPFVGSTSCALHNQTMTITCLYEE